jgi:hypothetical protein
LVSEQSVGVVPTWQVPPEHESPVVQGLPSLQEAVLFACSQAPALQLSSVQGLLSLQSAAITQLGAGASMPASGSGAGVVSLQTPLLHTCPALQGIPHWPQFMTSDVVSTHEPPHGMAPPLQDSWQEPAEHTWPDGHMWPHAPQLFTSAEVSTHALPHVVFVQLVEPSAFDLLSLGSDEHPRARAAAPVKRTTAARGLRINTPNGECGERD